MTAAERAREVVQRHFGDHLRIALECSIEDAIRAAVAEERERILTVVRNRRRAEAVRTHHDDCSPA